jgi:hypothetical protein
MEIPNASYASSKYTRMPSTVTLVLIPKVLLFFVADLFGGLHVCSLVLRNFLNVFRCAGVCAMCGKQVLDTKLYRQSNV